MRSLSYYECSGFILVYAESLVSLAGAILSTPYPHESQWSI